MLYICGNNLVVDLYNEHTLNSNFCTDNLGVDLLYTGSTYTLAYTVTNTTVPVAPVNSTCNSHSNLSKGWGKHEGMNQVSVPST